MRDYKLIQLSLLILCVALSIYYMITTKGRSYSGPFCDLSKEEENTALNARQHLQVLSEQIGERHLLKYDQLLQAANYIETQIKSYGLKPQRHEFLALNKNVYNIQTILNPNATSKQHILIGAHYDSIVGSPGANDNASGVAALLELMRLLKNRKLTHTVTFVAFVNEEPPYFKTDLMGSAAYMQTVDPRQIKAMIAFDLLAYYSDLPNSQQYPFFFNFFYPHTGNFLAFVSNLTSKPLLQQAISSFRYVSPVPSEGIAAPAFIPGIDWSDHRSFWAYHIPAILITDTGPYRYPYYHSADDTLDKIDVNKLAQVIQGLSHVITDLANDGIQDSAVFSQTCHPVR